jgi:hypothetical protein
VAKKKKSPVGSLGPKPHWLKLSVADRERTKQYIKEGLQGYVRQDGIRVPGARRIYSGLTSKDGFDLRHIERWPAARLRTARERIQALNTLTGRNFATITPHSKRQRKAAQNFTGQDLPYQKVFIVQIQDPKRDQVHFRNNKVTIERKYESGIKQIKQRYLFEDYLEYWIEDPETGEEIKLPTLNYPVTFDEMREVTKRMLDDMPQNIFGGWAYYTILTIQYGPIGQSVPKHRVMDLLIEYHARYDRNKQHEGFAEQVIGFQMVGTNAQAKEFERLREKNRTERKKLKKLRFSAKLKRLRCPVMRHGKQCVHALGHKGKHKFKVG